MENILWYTKPTDRWDEGLPIGNGRLAGMVVNTEKQDRIQLNHEWLWRGVCKDRENEHTADKLPQVREALLKGDFLDGTALANSYFGGYGGISGIPRRVDPYQTAGELVFEEYDSQFAERSLEIDRSVAYSLRLNPQSNAVISRAFVSCKDNFIVYTKNGFDNRFSGECYFTRVKDENACSSVKYTDNSITFDCAFNRGQKYKFYAEYHTDGKVEVLSDKIIVKDASFFDLFANIAVEHKGIEEELAAYPLPKPGYSAEKIIKDHIDAFSEVANRMTLWIDTPVNQLPTDERIKNVKDGQEDSGLAMLYYNYGKYLLMCSSICGELPANLQGKWNDMIDPPWQCDYHFDINIEMNYWAAEQNNMGECAEALLKYCERFVPHAKKAAKDLYGCRGIYMPITSDCWGRATPEAYGWAVWIGSAPWIAQHFWNHYLYSDDKAFLKDRAYPFFKEIAEFYEDYLIKGEDGRYMILPSQSPENRFEGTGEYPVSIGINSAMDVQLCYDALSYAINSAEILKTDADKVEIWKELKANLPEFKIGSDGRLLEWDIERKEVEPGHRHLSHLYGLYPSDIFNKEDTPELYQAAEKSLNFRLSQGGGHTGWSRAWVSCLYARLCRSDLFYEHFTALIKDFATSSLLDLHPPRIFQIDGNLGAVAAVTEALFGYHNGKVRLLQALPEQWKGHGKVTNAKTAGGHLLSFEWKNGEVVDINVSKASDKPLVVVYNNTEKVF